jgi:hypothetical protein
MTTLTIETLLERAYDLEPAGQLAEAARLRAIAHQHQSQVLPTADADDILSGTIHGIPVYGSYFDEPGEPYHGRLYGGELEWNGRSITFYVDRHTITIEPVQRAALVGDIHLDD